MNKKITANPKALSKPNGKKAPNNRQPYTVGRIKYKSWATNVLKARNIVVYETELVHITNKHRDELSTIGSTAIDLVLFVVQNFNEIRRGKGESLLLIVRRNSTSNMAAIELVLGENKGKEVYKITTASPISTKKLLLKELLCANDR